MGWTDLLSMIFSGSFVGLLGSVANKVYEFKMEKQKAENIRLQGELDIKIIQAENEGRFKVAQTEAEAQMDVAASNAFAASYQLEPKMYHSNSKITAAQNSFLVIVDGIRGLVRPMITFSLCVIMMVVYLKAGHIIENKDLTPEQALKIYTDVTEAVIWLTTFSVSWWFGERSAAGKLKKK